MSIARISPADAALILEWRAANDVVTEAGAFLQQARTEYWATRTPNGAMWGAYADAKRMFDAACDRLAAFHDRIEASTIPEDFDFVDGAYTIVPSFVDQPTLF